MDWVLYAWLKRGHRRKEVLMLLSHSHSPLTVNDIKDTLKIQMSQSSFSVNELHEKGLVDCLNPNDKIGRLYKINTTGVEVLNDM